MRLGFLQAVGYKIGHSLGGAIAGVLEVLALFLAGDFQHEIGHVHASGRAADAAAHAAPVTSATFPFNEKLIITVFLSILKFYFKIL